MTSISRADHGVKHVLLITYGFPPEGGGGSMRATKLAKYLPQFGWMPAVIAARALASPTVVAPSMDHLVPVYRAPRVDVTEAFAGIARLVRRMAVRFRQRTAQGNDSAESTVAPTKRSRLAEAFMIPDAHVCWSPGAVLLGLRAITEKDVKAIYSMSPIATTHLVGAVLHLLTGLPWVIEFRDPWTFNPFRPPRATSWLDMFERRLEHAVLRRATHIVVTSAEYREEFLALHPDLPTSKFTIIPNGYDPDDFVDVQPKSFDRWTIVHAGAFYAARSARPFLEALTRFFDRRPSAYEQTQVLLVGPGDEVTRDTIDELHLRGIVRQVGTVAHPESIAYITGADVLLLVPGPGRGTMPGKTFEYLVTGKPILALAGEGTVRTLIRETGAGISVDAEDREGIAGALATLFDERGKPPLLDTSRTRELYDRRNIARAMARLLDTLTTRPSVHLRRVPKET